MNPRYKPYEQRKPDTQYKHNLKRVLKRGRLTGNPFQTQQTLTHLTLPPMNFKLENGFPLITERKAGFWRDPIGELLGFIHGVRTTQELKEKWGCKWWDNWATADKCADFGLPPGDLGPGSYGPAFHDFPMPDGGTWNQFKEVIQQMKDFPSLRSHKITSWIPYYCVGKNRKVVVAPCHGEIQITVIDGKLTLRMTQRSGDFPIGVPSNMVQYAALTIMIAHITGNEPYMYIHVVNDAQMYLDQETHVREIISRVTPAYPTLMLTKEGLEITDLYDFRPEHFELSDYHPAPGIPRIPATI